MFEAYPQSCRILKTDAFKARPTAESTAVRQPFLGSTESPASHVLTISGDPRERAKALVLGKWCVVYWEDYRFYLLLRD